MKTHRVAALVALLAVAAVQAPVEARDPSQSDFDACNREAQRGGPGAVISPGASAAVPTAPTPGAPGSGFVTAPGVTMGGALSDRSTTGPRPSRTREDLRGLASGSQNDRGYQELYRDCMKRRGF